MERRIVIELTDVDDTKEVSRHYGRRFRHLSLGKLNERVTYEVINGGWTAGVYKDGRLSINGKFPRFFASKPNSLVAVTFFKFVDTNSNDYTEVIHKYLPSK